jgi:predicted mannosyl-3-phosphoglycerate phosphatase (HAD superfamily)
LERRVKGKNVEKLTYDELNAALKTVRENLTSIGMAEGGGAEGTEIRIVSGIPMSEADKAVEHENEQGSVG